MSIGREPRELFTSCFFITIRSGANEKVHLVVLGHHETHPDGRSVLGEVDLGYRESHLEEPGAVGSTEIFDVYHLLADQVVITLFLPVGSLAFGGAVACTFALRATGHVFGLLVAVEASFQSLAEFLSVLFSSHVDWGNFDTGERFGWNWDADWFFEEAFEGGGGVVVDHLFEFN